MFFNLGSCPSGWSELTVASGRYLVGTGDLEGRGTRDTRSAQTGITVNNEGEVAGTNSPYIQLLVCQKD